MKSIVLILFTAFISVYIIFNRLSYENNMFKYDCGGYYIFLPAIFVYHDIANMAFYPEVNNKYELSPGCDDYGLIPQPTGKRTNKYAVGTAAFELPFFLIAHIYCSLTQRELADGYSTPYQFGGIACFIFWTICGLLYLRKFLSCFFSDGVVAFTLLCVYFGTNLYCYTVFAPGMSHPIAFFLFAAVLYHTHLYYARVQRKHLYLLGLLLGLVVITRPSDMVLVVVPLLWGIYDRDSFAGRLGLLKDRIKDITGAGVFFLAVCMIQMAYWKYTSGDWIHYSYTGEGFNFLRPHIAEGLAGYEKGWFIYTPLALIGVAGFFFMRGSNRKYIPSLVLCLALMVYVVFSWRQWWYGGGFGARAMIDALPLLALPLASLTDRICNGWKNMGVRIAGAIVFLFVVALNLFQTYQYSCGTIHYVRMSKAYYWRVFGKVTATEEDVKYLQSDEEFGKQVEDSRR